MPSVMLSMFQGSWGQGPLCCPRSEASQTLGKMQAGEPSRAEGQGPRGESLIPKVSGHQPSAWKLPQQSPWMGSPAQ